MAVLFEMLHLPSGNSYKIIVATGLDTFHYYFTQKNIKTYDIAGVLLKVLPFTFAITTKNMEFSIDLLFLKKDYSIIKRVYNVQPNKQVFIPFGTKYVLETLPGIVI
ncbi:MAG: hypothetical protein QXU98_13765 [Candidatus Parvarchaeota archaeon]